MSKGDPSETASMEKKKERDVKKKKRWPLIAPIVATILILSGFAYWYLTFVPDLEGFMDNSYSPGEKAEFRAKVTEMELIETSYGNATLVYFDDYGIPFCFLGNHSGKYKVGKTVTVEVTFHKYGIYGTEMVLLEELILGCHLQLEELFLEISHSAGIGLTGTVDSETPEYYYLNVSTLMYPHKTFSLDLYEHALNRICEYDYVDDDNIDDDDDIEISMGDGESKFGKKGSFGYDCSIFASMVYLNSIAHCRLEVNCTDLKNDPNYLPDRIQFMDRDNDRNISLGDSYRIDMEPTDSQYDLDFYMFNIGGITAGTNIILNWYDGPFYSLDRFVYYSLGPVEEGFSDGINSVRMSIQGVSGKALDLSEINMTMAERGYAPRWIFEEEIYDGIEAKLDSSRFPSDSPQFDVIFSFHDGNGNGLLDAGDHFLLENMRKNFKLEFLVKDSENNLILHWTYTVTQGMDTGQYPLIAMDEPFRSNGNISINVTGVDVYFPEIDRVYYVLDVPEKDIHFDTGRRVDEIYSNDNTVRFAINDTNEDGFLTKEDRVEIDGLEPGTDYIFKILSWHGYPVYELEGIA